MGGLIEEISSYSREGGGSIAERVYYDAREIIVLLLMKSKLSRICALAPVRIP